MKPQKAIARYSLFYVIILSLITIASLINTNIVIDKVLRILQLLLILVPPSYIIFKSKYRNILILNITFVVFVLGTISITFRKIRDIFPDPAVGKETSIGYAQYFGYPLYLDQSIFFTLLISPLTFFIFFKLIYKLKHKTKNEK